MRRLLLPLLLAGCLGPLPRREPPPPPPPSPSAPPEVLSPDGGRLARVPDDAWPSLRDDGGLQDLAAAVRESVSYYRGLDPGTLFTVGDEKVSAARMAEALEDFLGIIPLDPSAFEREVKALFRLYRSPGAGERGDVTFSAYYEHALDAALSPGGEYQFPLYAKPGDLVEIDGPRGRTVGRHEGGKLVPYYTRAEIDGGGVLEGKGLEIAWAADPLDIFFLQVQGSGWLRLPGGSAPLRVRFAAHNGHPYRSVGGEMIRKGLFTAGGNAREKLVRYMRAHPENRQELLNVNPRYVFFRLDRGPGAPFAFGSIQRPLTPRRSVAADKALFPPGALAFMDTDNPAAHRFILIQDEGGAIKGPARIDYFMGAGKGAEEDAIAFWTPGRFYVLVPR